MLLLAAVNPSNYAGLGKTQRGDKVPALQFPLPHLSQGDES
jgi:hypothetical protein